MSLGWLIFFLGLLLTYAKTLQNIRFASVITGAYRYVSTYVKVILDCKKALRYVYLVKFVVSYVQWKSIRRQYLLEQKYEYFIFQINLFYLILV